MKRRIARWMRTMADRLDYRGAPRSIGWSFTFETGEGVRFRQDGRGCRLWYFGDDAYELAHLEADSRHGQAWVEAIARLRDASDVDWSGWKDECRG